MFTRFFNLVTNVMFPLYVYKIFEHNYDMVLKAFLSDIFFILNTLDAFPKEFKMSKRIPIMVVSLPLTWIIE